MNDVCVSEHHQLQLIMCIFLHNKNIMNCVTFKFKLTYSKHFYSNHVFLYFSLSVIVSLDVTEGFHLLFQFLSLLLSGFVLIWSVCPLIGLSESSNSALNKVSVIPSETTITHKLSYWLSITQYRSVKKTEGVSVTAATTVKIQVFGVCLSTKINFKLRPVTEKNKQEAEKMQRETNRHSCLLLHIFLRSFACCHCGNEVVCVHIWIFSQQKLWIK